MADADIPITAGSGTKVDTRTVGAGGDEHRQVMVIGDPTTAANVAIVSSGGALRTDNSKPATGTNTSPTQATANTNQTVLASNAARLGATITNDIAGNMYIKCGATASATSFTTILRNRYDYYEVPFQYTGIIDAMWDVANGVARVTEFT